jgi:autotransporter passenger strand-loop-strand repeat protein
MTSSTVSSGQFVSGLSLQSGDALTVLSGGSATRIIVGTGAALLLDGGTAQDDTIYGGTEQGTGLTTSETLLAGGVMLLSTGGVATDTLIGAGGSQTLAGAAAVSTTVFSGGLQTISHGTASATILSGGQQSLTNGSTTGTVIDQGGMELLAEGQGALNPTAFATTVNAGGVLLLAGYATASGAIVTSGGLLSATNPNAIAVDPTIASGGSAVLTAGGVLGAHIDSGGQLFLSHFAQASFDVVASGGTQTDASLLGAVQTTLNGGTEYVQSGASISTLIGSGGTQQIGGPTPEFGAYRGTASNAVVTNGGTQTIDQGGIARNTLVESGGAVYVFSGLTISATVLSGGIISDQGTASSTQISAGGEQVIDQYAFASATLIQSGGLELVDRAGIANATTIAAGGVQLVMGAAGLDGFSAQYGVAVNTVVDSGGILRLDGLSYYDNPLQVIPDAQLLSGGAIDVTTLPYASTEIAVLNTTTDLLTISGGAFGVELQLSGDYTNDVFSLAADALGGTNITDDGTPCFCRGTHIQTDRGEIPVEHLRIGDNLITHAGQSRPLRWIGRRAYTGSAAAAAPDALPILFRAGSLGGGLPRRDLRVSPHHALHLDGVLIQADSLINTTTIIQLQKVDRVEYFHLELETHDIILAEGAPAETYLEEHNRAMFHNASDYAARYPNAAPKPPHSCAPRINHGPILHQIRRRLAAPTAAPPPLRGFVEHIDRGRIAGWAQSGQSGAVRLRLAANGVTLAAFHATRPRADVVAAIGGDLCCGFDHIIEGGLPPDPSQTIAVIRVTDGAMLARL